MTEQECLTLIDSVSGTLGVAALLTPSYRSELIREADGHPYVIKILLGEVAKAKKLVKPERIVATQDEILSALFERTFAFLSAPAQRVFLLLCCWRSVVPEVALEAVVLRSQNERINVRRALGELAQASFVEETVSENDSELFIGVPLAATMFGRRKLVASPLKTIIDADAELLRAFGAGRREDVRHGVLPRIRRVLRNLAQEISGGRATLEESQPMLEFLASRAPDVWLELADLYLEVGADDAPVRGRFLPGGG